MRASTSSTPFLKQSDTNDINIITSPQCPLFYLCIIHNFNDSLERQASREVATALIHSGYSLLQGTFFTQ